MKNTSSEKTPEETIRTIIKSKNINAVVLCLSQRVYMVENGLILSWVEFLEKYNNEIQCYVIRDFVAMAHENVIKLKSQKNLSELTERYYCGQELICSLILQEIDKIWLKKLYHAE